MSAMKNRRLGMCRIVCGAAVALAAAAVTGAAQENLRSEIHAIAARLFAMGDRVISPREWTELMASLDGVARRAEAATDHGAAIQCVVARARAWGELARNPAYAAQLLGAERRRWNGATHPELRQVYLTEAEMLSRVGESDAIRRLIDEYRASPLYDPAPMKYAVEGDRTPEVTMVRPRAPQTESPLVLGMMRHLHHAKASAGARLPDFILTDIDGAAYSPGSMQGRVTLIDFWVAGSVPWERSIPFLRRARELYGAQGFEVIGVSQNLDAAGIRSFAAARARMDWPQVEGRAVRSLILQLGIPGENASFLVDRHGRVRGRNLRGNDLIEAVGQLLAEP